MLGLGIAQRFGGSHAQRDILTATAEALCEERLQHKPRSPWARRLNDQAIALQDIDQLELAH